MSLLNSSNPTLSEKIFNRAHSQEQELNGTMTVRGTMNKFGFLLIMILAGAAYTWNQYMSALNPSSVFTLMWVGLLGGFVTALVISFKPKWAPYLAPVYGLLEGLFLGAISVVINEQFKESYPGIVMQAVGLTFGTAIAMFLLYNFRIIKATEKFKSIMLTAVMGVAIFYLIYWVGGMFGLEMPFMSWNNGSWLSIGITLVVIAIAALTLILDFDMIEKGAESGAPKYMEWYGAFGLAVTIIWLYIQMLKLLSQIASRD